MFFPFSTNRTARASVAMSVLTLCVRASKCVGVGALLGGALIAHAQRNNPSVDPWVERRAGNSYQGSLPITRYFEFSPTSHPVLPGQWWANPAFVPPQPPALGEMLSAASAHAAQPGNWRALADCVGENFYMAYASLLREDSLSDTRKQRIEQYNAARHRLADEMRAHLDELKDAPPPDRTAALTLLATRQDAELRAVESEAEAIRHDLTTGGAFAPADNGQDLDLRTRGLTETGREYIALLEAAQYLLGFSNDQRLLLQEMACETRASLQENSSKESVATPYLYFLPANARIHLPEKLPGALEAKVKVFLAAKERLKEELRATIHRKGFLSLPRQRAEQFSQLAEQQAPQFAVLETLAEEIRLGLTSLPYPDKPDRSPLTEDLARRVGTFSTGKAEVQRELFRQLRAFNGIGPGVRFQIVRQGDGLAIAQTEAAKSAPSTLATVNADLANRYTALAHEAEVLRQEIQRLTEANPQYRSRTVDQLAAEFVQAHAAQENWNRYRDYYQAVLEPGLSPAQRRLLFGVALSDLAHIGDLASP